MSQRAAIPIGIPTELPTLSHLGLAPIANKDVNFPSLNTQQHSDPTRDLYTKPLESFPSDYSIYAGRPRLEEARFPSDLFKQTEYAEPVPKRTKVEAYFEDIRKPLNPKQNLPRQLDSKIAYESSDSCLVGNRSSKFGLDHCEKEFPPVPSTLLRHQSYNKGSDTSAHDRYLYSDVESRPYRARIPMEHSEWDIPRRRLSQEGHMKLPPTPCIPNGVYDHPFENEYGMNHEYHGHRGHPEREYKRRPDMYTPQSAEYWNRADARTRRYSLSKRSTISSGLDKVAENSKILHQFAMDFGYVPQHHGQPISLPPDHLLKQMTNYTYDILQALMSLRSESLRTNIVPEGEMEREDSEEESSKLEDEDMKYIRDKRSLLANSKSKYQKRTRNGSSQPRRCHACNTTETPEWRRGPDGARTLCNACGLHYAKLTRKRTLAAAGTNEDKED